MQDALYQSAGSAGAPIQRGQLARFILKTFSCAFYGLLVVVDGLSGPESYDSRFLTLPFLIGGLALARSICEALDHGYEGHAALFALGLSTLGGLA